MGAICYKGAKMTYINEESGKEVKVLEITPDNYVRFKMNGIEIFVAKKRFDKVYKPKGEK